MHSRSLHLLDIEFSYYLFDLEETIVILVCSIENVLFSLGKI